MFFCVNFKFVIFIKTRSISIHSFAQIKKKLEIKYKAGTSKITEENLVEFNTDVNLTQNDLYSSSSSSGTHANYLEDNWDIQKTYDGRPSSSVRFVKLTIRTN